MTDYRRPSSGPAASLGPMFERTPDQEYDFYDGTPPHEASATSLEAAKSVAVVAGTLRAKVLAYIESKGPTGCIVDDVEADLGMLHQTAGARVRELVLAGQVRANGETRLTRSRRRAQVWVAADHAPPAPSREPSSPRWFDRAIDAVHACALDNEYFYLKTIVEYLEPEDVPTDEEALDGVVIRAMMFGWFVWSGAVAGPGKRIDQWRSLIAGTEIDA